MRDGASPIPRRYLAIWFPFLPADRLRRTERRALAPSAEAPDRAGTLPGRAGTLPVVFVEPVRGAQRISALDRRALALGLRPGLALADARARIPVLRVVEHDPAADEALIGALARDCDRWTALVAPDPPHGLMLDVTGTAHLFGGEAGLWRGVTERLSGLGLEARATIAGTPDAARALARFGAVSIVPPGSEAAALRPLPIGALELSEETRLALSRAGLKRIRDLADRPSRPLAARFGDDLMRRLARVLGREDRRIVPRRTPPPIRVEEPFPEPLMQADAIEGVLADLLARAAHLLEARGEGGRVFEADFFRTDGAVRSVRVATGRPVRDPEIVLRLFRDRLGVLADPLDPGFGFDLICLGVPVAEPLAARQDRLVEARLARVRPAEPDLPAPAPSSSAILPFPSHRVRPSQQPPGSAPPVASAVPRELRHLRLVPCDAPSLPLAGRRAGGRADSRGTRLLPSSVLEDTSRASPACEGRAGWGAGGRHTPGSEPIAPLPGPPRRSGLALPPAEGRTARGREGRSAPISTSNQDHDQIGDLVDRLVARLGARRVVRLAPGDSHDPVRASRIVPAADPATKPPIVRGVSIPPAWADTQPCEPPLRPLRLFDPPQPIDTMAEVPDGPPARFRWRRVTHEIATAEGPERIAPEWWREPGGPAPPDGRTRDYYRVEDVQGRRFWVFRQGLYGESDSAAPCWFVHGLFA